MMTLSIQKRKTLLYFNANSLKHCVLPPPKFDGVTSTTSGREVLDADNKGVFDSTIVHHNVVSFPQVSPQSVSPHYACDDLTCEKTTALIELNRHTNQANISYRIAPRVMRDSLYCAIL